MTAALGLNMVSEGADGGGGAGFDHEYLMRRLMWDQLSVLGIVFDGLMV